MTPIGWPDTDQAIDRMVKSGEMTVVNVIREVDGRPIYWLVERER